MTITVNIQPNYGAAYDAVSLKEAFQTALQEKHRINHKRVMADCMSDELPPLLDVEAEEIALAWLSEQVEKGASQILTVVPISDTGLDLQIKEQRVLAL